MVLAQRFASGDEPVVDHPREARARANHAVRF